MESMESMWSFAALAAITGASALGCSKVSTASPLPAGTFADASGSYTIASSSKPGGAGAYTGSAKVRKTASTYALDWTVTSSAPYHGVGIPIGDTLAVGWGEGSEYGVVVYQVAGGKLDGAWATSATGGATGTESLEGPAGLDGSYKITSGTNPKGVRYGGTVDIATHGDVRWVTWRLASGTGYSGVGILDGDTFIVGWGIAGKGAGVVDYKVSGPTLTGKWAVPGGTTLGSEVLERD
jgi:hypothetical protein